MSDERPYAKLSFAEVLDDYVLVRGDLSAEYARKQLVREHEARLDAARAEHNDAALDKMVARSDAWRARVGLTRIRAKRGRGK